MRAYSAALGASASHADLSAASALSLVLVQISPTTPLSSVVTFVHASAIGFEIVSGRDVAAVEHASATQNSKSAIG